MTMNMDEARALTAKAVMRVLLEGKYKSEVELLMKRFSDVMEAGLEGGEFDSIVLLYVTACMVEVNRRFLIERAPERQETKATAEAVTEAILALAKENFGEGATLPPFDRTGNRAERRRRARSSRRFN